jgi:hypothetical protein
MMEKFHHTLPDGYEIVLPHFNNIKLGIIRATRKLPQADQMFTLLESICTEEDLEHLDDLDRGQFNEFSVAWRDASGVGLGESSASSTS